MSEDGEYDMTKISEHAYKSLLELHKALGRSMSPEDRFHWGEW